jgi:hypothetical protein
VVAGDVRGGSDVQAEAAVVGWVDPPLDRAMPEFVELQAGHLGDGQRTEMTYKLGMRASAVMTAGGLDGGTPGAVLKQVRLLYAWRSALAHGGNEEKARRKYEEAARAEGDGVRAATNLVRVILRQLVQSSELRDPLALDARLIGATAADMNEEDEAGA